MLLQFSAQNHRSLRDKQTLSMVASTDRADDARLIPCPAIRGAVQPVAAVYGANASGKSNLVSAMLFMARAVLQSHQNWKPGGPVPWQPFLLADATPATATYEMSFITSGLRCRYGFALSPDRIEEEWLHTWPNGKKQVWLERQRDKFTFGKRLQGENEAIRKLTRPNSLFLSAAAQNNHAALSQVYGAFSDPNMVGRRAVSASSTAEWFIASELARLTETSNAAQLLALNDLMRASDTGVLGFSVGPPPESAPPGIPVQNVISFQHRSVEGKAPSLQWADESGGTQALLVLGVRLFKVLDVGGLFIIDELEASLHPSLARRIVELFQDPKQNPKRAQLVFTTHDTNLLGSTTGDPVLRRDQVWLTEKDEAGATTLYPLTDFSPRKQENLERGYLQGRYGAVPFLGPFVSGESSHTDT